ncbi:AAA family ATPase [Clostridium tagluense]|uniref:Endonuclease GajA/Old nuclease/RecF-like AAA domain-containing protein n=1 Tax=Clostridium tagluense TaxID=360422 RepID=A0A401ULC0_9CLOT|nr:AAA family ATPase [Clostridium tagluense]GCD10344.1 hypothetical protein Ctaglu_19670 [Clostridium tagluense]
MQGIQLVYFCLVYSDTGLNNIELAFSNHFEFHVQEFHEKNLECKVLISKKEKTDSLSEEFWGEEKHVSRVDLLVGENGAGKSTIMDCLGGQGSGQWFALYLEIVDGKLNWFFNTDVDYPVNIEILEDWNIENIIKPKEIGDASYACRHIPNVLSRSWVNNYGNPDDFGIIAGNKPAAVYNFVKHELPLLQKYFPAENLAYQFSIPVDLYSMMKFFKNRKVNGYLKTILETATLMISESKDCKLNIRTKEQYGYGEIDEDYIKYRQHSDALLVDCFYQEEFSNERLNLLKMIVYVYWVMHITNVKNIQNLECQYNMNSLLELNSYLKNVLNSITNKSKNMTSSMKIIREYIEFDFIEKLFSFVEEGWLKIRIGSTGSIGFKIFLNEKVDKEIDMKILNLINFTNQIKTRYNDDNIKSLKLQWVGFGNMSSGELAFIDLFSSISGIFSLNIISDEEENYEFEKYNKASNYLFLLDEPDAGFHPEWSRRLIYYVTTFINSLLSETNNKCQFIITTHSPFMVSDMPSDYVTCIKLELDENGTYNRTIKKPKHSFAANIYELLNDGFFMDAPVGEFACSMSK